MEIFYQLIFIVGWNVMPPIATVAHDVSLTAVALAHKCLADALARFYPLHSRVRTEVHRLASQNVRRTEQEPGKTQKPGLGC